MCVFFYHIFPVTHVIFHNRVEKNTNTENTSKTNYTDNETNTKLSVKALTLIHLSMSKEQLLSCPILSY